MAQHSSPFIQELEPVHWQLDVPNELTKDLTTRLFSNHANFEETDIQDFSLAIAGYGERKWAVERWLQTYARLGIPVVAALVDVRQVSATASNIEAYSFNFSGRAALEMQERGLSGLRTTAFGHSLGGGIIGLGLRDHSDKFGKVGLGEPICLDTAVLALQKPDIDERRARNFRRFGRVIVGSLFQQASPSERFHAGNGLIEHLWDDSRPYKEHRFKQQRQLSVTLDAGPYVLAHAASGQRVAIVFGEADPLVIRQNVLQSLDIHMENPDHPEWVKGRQNIHDISTHQKHSFVGWADGANHTAMLVDQLGLTKHPLAT